MRNNLNDTNPNNFDEVSIDPEGDISYIKPKTVNATVA